MSCVNAASQSLPYTSTTLRAITRQLADRARGAWETTELEGPVFTAVLPWARHNGAALWLLARFPRRQTVHIRSSSGACPVRVTVGVQPCTRNPPCSHRCTQVTIMCFGASCCELCCRMIAKRCAAPLRRKSPAAMVCYCCAFTVLPRWRALSAAVLLAVCNSMEGC